MVACCGSVSIKCVLCCRTSRQAVDEQKKIESQLVIEVDTARSRMSQIQQELEVVVEQLGEAKVSRLPVSGPFSIVPMDKGNLYCSGTAERWADSRSLGHSVLSLRIKVTYTALGQLKGGQTPGLWAIQYCPYG